MNQSINPSLNPNHSLQLPTITHNKSYINNFYYHSLTVDGIEGKRVAYNEVARNGSFCAVTSYYNNFFPEVFMMLDFTSVAMKQTHRDCYSEKKEPLHPHKPV